MKHLTIPVAGVDLHVIEAGPETGPLVFLLHGFPEYGEAWRRQIAHLAAAGFRVWAPDQRGYNLSDKPKDIAAYALDTLAADVIGLIDAAGRDKAFIVGHDWGGFVAWWLTEKYPQRVERLIAINIPHPVAFRRHIIRSPRQMLRSWYAFFFQIPWLPEKLVRWRDWWAGARILRTSSRAGTFTDEALQAYREAWSRPGALTAMLNWYRAALRMPFQVPAAPRIQPPTLILWGALDQFLDPEMVRQSVELCDDGRAVFVENATHWVHHEEPAWVNAHIQEFFEAGK